MSSPVHPLARSLPADMESVGDRLLDMVPAGECTHRRKAVHWLGRCMIYFSFDGIAIGFFLSDSRIKPIAQYVLTPFVTFRSVSSAYLHVFKEMRHASIRTRNCFPLAKYFKVILKFFFLCGPALSRFPVMWVTGIVRCWWESENAL